MRRTRAAAAFRSWNKNNKNPIVSKVIGRASEADPTTCGLLVADVVDKKIASAAFFLLLRRVTWMINSPRKFAAHLPASDRFVENFWSAVAHCLTQGSQALRGVVVTVDGYVWLVKAPRSRR